MRIPLNIFDGNSVQFYQIDPSFEYDSYYGCPAGIVEAELVKTEDLGETTVVVPEYNEEKHYDLVRYLRY